MKKTTRLKELLTSSELTFLMEAHNGLSAKIVEEAGFDGIWGSGLSISAALGVRDNNEASWTQILEVVEFMSDATTIPLLLDGDTGYGNFNNMRRLVTKLQQRNIAGVCIEDKIFPKTNSFLRGEAQPLADIDEFCGKIKAGLDASLDDDFCVVARVEALIAGWGMEEALKRAEAYRQAGATAILMHSKKSNAGEIFEFMKEWDNRHPVVIVPTKYYSTPTEQFRTHRISTVIWANHLVRSSVASMQRTAKQIFEDQNLHQVEDQVATVQEIFRLQNDAELESAEKLYFKSNSNKKAIILAASRGKELGELTQDRPKALIEISGKPILKELIDKFNAKGIQQIGVVRGYKKEVYPDFGVRYFDNDNYENSSELTSLYQSREMIEGDCIISYGDIVFRSFVIDLLAESECPITLLVDTDLTKRSTGYIGDFVYFNPAEVRAISHDKLASLKFCALGELEKTPHGEWTGLIGLRGTGSKVMMDALNELSVAANFSSLKVGDLINLLLERGVDIGIETIQGHWADIDNFEDLQRLQRLV
jgi:phosphoenolpyruvate phosphomutase